MKNCYLHFLVVFLFSGSVLLHAQEIKINWTLETEKADWQPRDSHAEYVFRNHIWIMEGRRLPGTECSNKV